MTEQTQPLPLEPMILPEVPSWFPLAWGWWATAAAAIILVLLVVWLIKRKRNKAKAKQAALRLLAIEPITPSSAMEILRQAVLSYFPREQVAQLHGENWYQFLDEYGTQPTFVTKQRKWEATLYSKAVSENSDELIQDCVNWVAQALPPKKRRGTK